MRPISRNRCVFHQPLLFQRPTDGAVNGNCMLARTVPEERNRSVCKPQSALDAQWSKRARRRKNRAGPGALGPGNKKARQSETVRGGEHTEARTGGLKQCAADGWPRDRTGCVRQVLRILYRRAAAYGATGGLGRAIDLRGALAALAGFFAAALAAFGLRAAAAGLAALAEALRAAGAPPWRRSSAVSASTRSLRPARSS